MFVGVLPHAAQFVGIDGPSGRRSRAATRRRPRRSWLARRWSVRGRRGARWRSGRGQVAQAHHRRPAVARAGGAGPARRRRRPRSRFGGCARRRARRGGGARSRPPGLASSLVPCRSDAPSTARSALARTSRGARRTRWTTTARRRTPRVASAGGAGSSSGPVRRRHVAASCTRGVVGSRKRSRNGASRARRRRRRLAARARSREDREEAEPRGVGRDGTGDRPSRTRGGGRAWRGRRAVGHRLPGPPSPWRPDGRPRRRRPPRSIAPLRRRSPPGDRGARRPPRPRSRPRRDARRPRVAEPVLG